MAPTLPPRPSPEDRDLLRLFRHLGLVFLLGTVAWLAVTLHGSTFPRDGSSLVLGRDFLNFWMYGRAAAGPDAWRWYDIGLYQQALAHLLGDGYPGQNWSYPPSVMLIAAPFGQMSYLLALTIWTVLGLALFVASGRSARIAVLSPAAVFALLSGQSSLLTAAAMICIFAHLDRRPLLAGLLIAGLTLKPQVGILFPILLLASRRWSALAAATGGAAAIAALTSVVFGPEAWLVFLRQGLPTQGLVMADIDGIATPFFPTLFMNLHGAGLPYAVAMGIQVAVACGAIGVLWWANTSRHTADPALNSALFCACSVAATPYLSCYDTLPLTAAVVHLVGTGRCDAHGRVLARAVFWLPLIQMVVGSFHVPGPAMIAPLLVVYLGRRLGMSGRLASTIPVKKADSDLLPDLTVAGLSAGR